MTMTLTACGTSVSHLERSLPPKPIFMSPVPVYEAKKGDDARNVAAKYKAAVSTANKRLNDSGAWYDNIRQEYAKGR